MLKQGTPIRKEGRLITVHFVFMPSGMDPTTAKGNHCTDTGKPCNACLDAAKACNLNNDCKKLRSTYISTCMKPVSPAEPCSRRKCHKALRQFFDRVSTEYSYRLLFCSCQEHACAERRRQTIVPSCSYEEKVKPNCLDLRNLCRTDHLCRYLDFCILNERSLSFVVITQMRMAVK